MRANPDGSFTCDKWDKRAIFYATKKFGRTQLKTDIDEINIIRDYMTKTIFHKIYYSIKYPFPRFGETLCSLKPE